MALNDQTTAVRMREIIARQMRSEINNLRPNARNGTVVSIAPDGYTCQVQFRDEAASVTVKLGALRPTQPGQTVRVQGPKGEPWVVDIVGGAALSGPTSDTMGMPQQLTLSGVGVILVATWIYVPYVSHYELQVAEDAGFTTGLLSYEIYSTKGTVEDLVVGQTYYARVRGVSNGGGSLGPWSDVKSLVIPGYPDNAAPDGFPPSSSPEALITPTIGALLVEWVPIVNNSEVTYEVHAGLESGFTPSGLTKITETTGTFAQVRYLADSSVLPRDNPTFVRIVARDSDGAATAGVQGSGTPDKVIGADFTQLVGDGSVPASSPETFNWIGGPGFLYLTWTPIDNADQTIYEIHLSPTPGFTPTAATLALETVGAFAFVRKLPANLGGGPLGYTTYYCVIWARDPDGYAPDPSAEIDVTPIKNQTTDIAPFAITNALIAEAAIGEANIQTAAITEAKIQNGAITNAKIAVAAIGQANIADAAIGTAQIANAAITDAKIAQLSANKITAGTINGITITGSTITGSTFQTAVTGARVSIAAGPTSGTVYYYSGNGGELFPGFISAGYGNDPFVSASGFLSIFGPKFSNGGSGAGAGIEFWQNQSTGRRSARINENLILEQATESTAFKLHVAGSNQRLQVRTGIDGLVRFDLQQTQTSIFYSTGNRELRCASNGALSVYENTTALWTASGTTISDRNLKKNIKAHDTGYLDTIRQIPMVKFEYDRDFLPQGERVGVLAQDVNKVFPQGVTWMGEEDDEDGNFLLDTTSMLMLALGAVKELDQRLKAIEDRGSV